MTNNSYVENHGDVYRFICKFIDEHKYSPSYREIADGVGMKSISMVSFYIKCLERDGNIRRQKGIPRSIVVTL